MRMNINSGDKIILNDDGTAKVTKNVADIVNDKAEENDDKTKPNFDIIEDDND